jgi:molecular chaperone GrpE
MVMQETKDELDIELENETDIITEDTELEDDEASHTDKIKDLRQKLKICEGEKTNTLEDLQRAKADFLNTRKRLEEEMYKDRDRQINNFIEKLTPLADSFTLAMSNKVAWEAIDKNWRMGVEGIYSQLQSLLRDYSVTTINEVNVMFDPQRHEAVTTVEVDNQEADHKVISVIQPGYERQSNGKTELIRPALVTVGEYKKS